MLLAERPDQSASKLPLETLPAAERVLACPGNVYKKALFLVYGLTILTCLLQTPTS